MGQPYVGEIRMFGGNFPPNGWMTCDGQRLAIAQYDTLFNLIGTTYGGDGQTTFALPNLSGRVPIHQGTASTRTTYTIGAVAGTTTVTLSTNQMSNHNHSVIADNNNATTNVVSPQNAYYGNATPSKLYSATSTNLATMVTLPSQGGSQPHENMQPYLAITYIISLFGVYPSPA
jgi:microcystin-dependent protein